MFEDLPKTSRLAEADLKPNKMVFIAKILS